MMSPMHMQSVEHARGGNLAINIRGVTFFPFKTDSNLIAYETL